MYHSLGFLLVCLEAAWGRDSSKPFRSMPAISNSLVNLGKMDISFHFNNKGPDSAPRTEHYTHLSNPFYYSKPDPVELEPCACSSLKNYKNPFLSSPSDMLNKILKSNDLFSFNQDPVISTMCCDSREHVQEDTVFFEFNPKAHENGNAIHTGLPSLPIMFDNFLQAKAPLAPGLTKPKAIEIFFFPKKKDGSAFDFAKLQQTKKKEVKKSEIQVVGDKELRNDFKTYKYRPTFPVLFKKDIIVEKQKEEPVKRAEEKIEDKIEDKHEEEETTKLESTTISSPNAL